MRSMFIPQITSASKFWLQDGSVIWRVSCGYRAIPGGVAKTLLHNEKWVHAN